jgi:two-component system alkaline phosphatase synthesis response regulator PhoP
MRTILVIEDELTIADMICAVLEDEGYRVIQAYNGREGLEYLAQSRPDLILCDLMMPILDGREFYKRMRENPSYRSIPVICASAIADAIAGQDPPYAALLKKPFDLNLLLATVKRLLPGS